MMLSQAAQMKKVMPAPVKNIPREQPASTMVTLGKNKLVEENAYIAKLLQKNMNYLSVETQALLVKLIVPEKPLRGVQ